MQGLKLTEKLKNEVNDFIDRLKNIFGDDLVSVSLYGSAASGEFADKHSNLNLLVVLRNTGLENLKRVSAIVNKFRLINPLFLTERYIANSTDIFPIEFLDMKENYLLLYGKDILKDTVVETRNLRFQCEQELKSKLINLRQLYIRINKDKPALRDLLFKSLTSVLHILRNVLRLKGKSAPYKKEDILKELALDFNFNLDVWSKILCAKQKKIKLNGQETEAFFVEFVCDLEKIVDVVDRL